MPDDTPLLKAFSKLNSAVQKLDGAIDSKLSNDTSLIDTEAEVQRMGADRARLAESLDEVQQRSQQLEHVNREVSRRLVDAMEKIRTVIEDRS